MLNNDIKVNHSEYNDLPPLEPIKTSKIQSVFNKIKIAFSRTSISHKKLEKEKSQYRTKCKKLGIDPQLVCKDFEGIKYLFQTKLIYSIVGFKHYLEVDEQSHNILIRAKGHLVPLKIVRDCFEYDALYETLIHKENKTKWNYYGQHGLVQSDRYGKTPLEPVMQISREEMRQLLVHAKKIDPSDNDPLKNCVFQIVTNPEVSADFGTNFLLKNLSRELSLHVGFRLITADGMVYSTGLGFPQSEGEYKKGLFSTFSTINGVPTILDYKEFYPHHGRIVTSIPTTEANMADMLEVINQLRQEGVRFNLLKQNCSRLTGEVLKKMNVTINNSMKLGKMIRSTFPSLKEAPGLGFVAKAISKAGSYTKKIYLTKTPRCIKRIFKLMGQVLFYLPKKMGTVLINLTVLTFGGAKSSPHPSNSSVNDLNNAEHITHFKAIYTSFKDIFSDKLNKFYHTTPYVQWQLSQNSTVTYPYKGKPDMGILPPVEADLPESMKLKEKLVRRYL